MRAAVVLSGCGFKDGSEIREAVLALLSLDKVGAEVECFAPDINQTNVVNHLTGEASDENRNVLVESARIARGAIRPLGEANADNFDVLVLPGGFGAALNLSNLATSGPDCEVLPEFKTLIQQFVDQQKPIGVICISPAVFVAAVKDQFSPTVTVGDDNDGLITSLGGNHQVCATDEIAVDEDHKIVSCSAYMRGNAKLADIAEGIDKLVQKVASLA